MNRKQILEALDQISDNHIQNAANPPKKKTQKVYWYSGIAAVLAIAVLLGVFLKPQTVPPSQILNPTVPTYPQVPTFTPSGPKLVALSGQTVSEAVYPASSIYDEITVHLGGWDTYFAQTMAQFLQGDENAVFSPMNLYMALAMLAETTGGDTRAEILSLLGAQNMDLLRWQANLLWLSCYRTGKYPCTLANSIWLQEGMTYNEDTMDLLAEKYYASVFGHDFTAENAAEPIAQWINKETGGLLQEQAGALEYKPETVFALLSTVYLQSEWYEVFEEEKNTTGVFNGTNGQTTCTYMNNTPELVGGLEAYYWGEDYSAVPIALCGGYVMWLILPDEGKTTDDLLKSGAYTELFFGEEKNGSYPKVNLSLPKFDISCKQDLIGGLQELGVTKVFERGQADFDPAFPENEVYVTQAEQAIRISVDENGVTAAAYADIAGETMGIGPLDEVDFILDRPFMFVLSTTDNVPLFAGCVNNL